MKTRLPAEWEPQLGVLLAFPHQDSDWFPYLSDARETFAAIIREISFREKVFLVVSPENSHVTAFLEERGVAMDRVTLIPIPTNDTWARDFGPITVEGEGGLLFLDFFFNGWGLKFPADRDNLVTGRLLEQGVFQTPRKIMGMALEGGGIESDGQGTILTTAECLLSPNRNPHLSREETEAAVKAAFGADRVLWLEHGYLAGDDTDSHIDTLARLCDPQTICYVQCTDREDEHYEELAVMEKELRAFRTASGEPYRLIPLPMAQPAFDDEGLRLPATYANFLILNGAVLVPTYNDPGDALALERIGEAFPDREIVGVDCRTLILQHGSLHCVTMQLPASVM